jgi:predicted nucleic acid-binding Zn ribbon protein
VTRRRDDGELRRLGDALEDVSRHLRMAPPPALRGVFGGWEELVGPATAAHATPRTLRDGVLTVVVDDPVWATQIRFLEADLVARIGGLVGADAVTAIRVVVNRTNRG